MGQLHPSFAYLNKRCHYEEIQAPRPYALLFVAHGKLRWIENEKEAVRKVYFKKRLEPFQVIKDAINIILLLLRQDLSLETVRTNKGFFQIKLNPISKNDLVIVALNAGSRIIPDISSNKYAINIQFSDTKHRKIDKEIKFKFGTSAF